MKAPDVITIGEILVEIMRPVAGQPLDQPGEFRGPFASGAPAIFAVAAARLGMHTGFIGGVGADAFGRMLIHRLEEEGVDTSQVQTPPDIQVGQRLWLTEKMARESSSSTSGMLRLARCRQKSSIRPIFRRFAGCTSRGPACLSTRIHWLPA